MKPSLCLSALLLALTSQAVCAQTTGASPAAPIAAASAPLERSDGTESSTERGQRVERIRHSDASNTIDEVREGGETKSITVTPKNNMPRYEVIPDQRNGIPGNSGNPQGGQRVWKVFQF